MENITERSEGKTITSTAGTLTGEGSKQAAPPANSGTTATAQSNDPKRKVVSSEYDAELQRTKNTLENGYIQIVDDGGHASEYRSEADRKAKKKARSFNCYGTLASGNKRGSLRIFNENGGVIYETHGEVGTNKSPLEPESFINHDSGFPTGTPPK